MAERDKEYRKYQSPESKRCGKRQEAVGSGRQDEVLENDQGDQDLKGNCGRDADHASQHDHQLACAK